MLRGEVLIEKSGIALMVVSSVGRFSEWRCNKKGAGILAMPAPEVSNSYFTINKING